MEMPFENLQVLALQIAAWHKVTRTDPSRISKFRESFLSDLELDLVNSTTTWKSVKEEGETVKVFPTL